MLSVEGKTLVVIRDELHKSLALLDDRCHPGKLADILQEQVQAVSTAASPGNVRILLLNDGSRSLADRGIVGADLYDLLRPELQHDKEVRKCLSNVGV
jgi:hypothetical protein